MNQVPINPKTGKPFSTEISPAMERTLNNLQTYGPACMWAGDRFARRYGQVVVTGSLPSSHESVWNRIAPSNLNRLLARGLIYSYPDPHHSNITWYAATTPTDSADGESIQYVWEIDG